MQKNSKIHDEYFEYCRKYSEEYGEKTIILLECGMFFEMYAIINDKISINPNIQTVCDLLNIILSRKNKSITEVSYNNPLMAGFPSQAVSKYTPILLSNNYNFTLGQGGSNQNTIFDIYAYIKSLSNIYQHKYINI